MAAFLGTAGNADCAAPHDHRDLADGAADCTGCRRDDYRLARLDARDVDEADHGRRTRLADETKTERERPQVGRQLAQSFTVEDDMLTPAELALHGVTHLEIRMAGLDHDAGAAPNHHIADFEGIGVLAVPTAHLPAHVGIDRQEMRARQDLAVGGLRHRSFDEAEATHIRHAVGHLDVDELAMCRHGGRSPGFFRSISDDDTVRRPWEDASEQGVLKPRNTEEGIGTDHQRRKRHVAIPWVPAQSFTYISSPLSPPPFFSSPLLSSLSLYPSLSTTLFSAATNAFSSLQHYT